MHGLLHRVPGSRAKQCGCGMKERFLGTERKEVMIVFSNLIGIHSLSTMCFDSPLVWDSYWLQSLVAELNFFLADAFGVFFFLWWSCYFQIIFSTIYYLLQRRGGSFWLLALDWLSPGHCSHLRSQPGDGRSFSFLSNKIKCYFKM